MEGRNDNTLISDGDALQSGQLLVGSWDYPVKASEWKMYPLGYQLKVRRSLSLITADLALSSQVYADYVPLTISPHQVRFTPLGSLSQDTTVLASERERYTGWTYRRSLGPTRLAARSKSYCWLHQELRIVVNPCLPSQVVVGRSDVIRGPMCAAIPRTCCRSCRQLSDHLAQGRILRYGAEIFASRHKGRKSVKVDDEEDDETSSRRKKSGCC